MKKILLFMLVLTLAFSFSACRKSPETDLTAAEDETTAAEELTEETTARELTPLTLGEVDPSEVLVVYFNGREGVETTAKSIAAGLSCDSFEIVPAELYPENEEEKLARANNEYENLLLPVLEGHVEDMSVYSVVVAVFPEFGGNLPMAVRTFMEDYDLRRTSLIPVCVCSGDDAGFALEQFASLMSLSPVYDGVAIASSDDIGAKTQELLSARLG